jgi:hypothetical protein
MKAGRRLVVAVGASPTYVAHRALAAEVAEQAAELFGVARLLNRLDI